MIYLFPALFFVCGVITIFVKKDLFGFFIGCQLFIYSGVLGFLFSGLKNGSIAESQSAAVFILFLGVGQLAGCLALAIRMFYLKGNINLKELRLLKK